MIQLFSQVEYKQEFLHIYSPQMETNVLGQDMTSETCLVNLLCLQFHANLFSSMIFFSSIFKTIFCWKCIYNHIPSNNSIEGIQLVDMLIDRKFCFYRYAQI